MANSIMVDNLAQLLLEKGVFTEDELYSKLKEVQELLGQKDIKMTMRYAYLRQENRKKAVSLLNELCHKNVTILNLPFAIL